MTESVPIPQIPTCLICNNFYERKPVIHQELTENESNYSNNGFKPNSVSARAVAYATEQNFKNALTAFVNFVGVKSVMVADEQENILQEVFSLLSPGSYHPCCDLCYIKLLEIKQLAEDEDDEGEDRQISQIVSCLLEAINFSSKDSGYGLISNLDPKWEPLRAFLIRCARQYYNRNVIMPSSSAGNEDDNKIEIEHWLNLKTEQEEQPKKPLPKKKGKKPPKKKVSKAKPKSPLVSLEASADAETTAFNIKPCFVRLTRIDPRDCQQQLTLCSNRSSGVSNAVFPEVEEPLPGPSKRAYVINEPVRITNVSEQQANIRQANNQIISNASNEVNSMAVFSKKEILKIIFEHISSINDFKQIRLVNKLWKDETLRKWRATAKLRVYIRAKLSDKNSLSERLKAVALEDLLLLTTYGQPLELYEVPFQNYRMLEISRFPMDMMDPWNTTKQEQFWRRVGSWMKHLQLDGAVFTREDALESLQNLFLNFCPNLEELIMTPLVSLFDQLHNSDTMTECCVKASLENSNLKTWDMTRSWIGYDCEEKCRFLPLFKTNYDLVTKTFKMLPNLQVLKGSHGVAHEIIDPLNYFTFSDQLIKLRVLKVYEMLDKCDLTRLHSYLEIASPPLESLRIQIHFEDTQNEHFKAILELAGNNLRKFDLEVRREHNEDQSVKFFDVLNEYKFSKLTSLKLRVCVRFSKKIEDFVPLDFQCLWNMPSLKILSYDTQQFMGVPKHVTHILSLKDLTNGPPHHYRIWKYSVMKAALMKNV